MCVARNEKISRKKSRVSQPVRMVFYSLFSAGNSPKQTGENHNEQTSRGRLPSIAANHRQPQSESANSPNHPRKKILLVGWRQNWSLPQAIQTRPACYRVAGRGYSGPYRIGIGSGDDHKNKGPELWRPSDPEHFKQMQSYPHLFSN